MMVTTTTNKKGGPGGGGPGEEAQPGGNAGEYDPSFQGGKYS
jgi:hypothetical protein